jgi:non-ribosomal peptide synthetase component F
MSILHRELSALYQAFSNGKGSPLATLPVQYADFAQWQREWLQGDVLVTQLGYWKKRLENIQTLHLPTDGPRPGLLSDRGARQSLVLSKAISEGLKSLSRQQGVTLFMTLLAAFQTLLYRYTGQEDIAVGSPIAGRNRQEIEGLIGFFVNTLVLRTDLTGAPSFLEVLGRVRESSLQAYAHQDLPFEKLVEELQPARNRSQNPLFQVMFILQNAPRETLEFAGLTMSSVKIDTTKAKFDLTLALQDEAEGLRGSLQYSSDLFKGETISRMLGHFRNLLEEIVANPEQRINDLPLLTAADRHQLLEEWNDTKRDYPSDKCIHQLFEEQVERSPDSIALVFEDRRVTYRELNSKANQLARHLKQFGVGADVAVAICMARSVEMMIALLGILKAGGAYVPLDPSYPAERLAFLLQDSGVAVLITEQALVDVFIGHSGKIISLDTEWEKIGQGNKGNLVLETSADSLAYVIYTSGSTGQPKGVAVSHRAVNRLVMNTDYVQITSSEVIAQASNVSFDAATFEIWGALLNGARLVMTTKDTLLTSQSLATAIERYGITTLFLTTALFNQMVEKVPAALARLRYLLFGGEAVGPQRSENC